MSSEMLLTLAYAAFVIAMAILEFFMVGTGSLRCASSASPPSPWRSAISSHRACGVRRHGGSND